MLRACTLKGRQGRAASAGLRRPCSPCTEPYAVERHCCQEALQVCVGEPKVTGRAQATASDALRVLALDAGTSGILLSEFLRRVPFSGGLPCFRGLARPWLRM